MNEILNELRNYFNNTPRDIIESELRTLEMDFGDVGPKVEDFLVYLDERNQWEFEYPNMNIKQTTPDYYNSEFFFTFANNNIQLYSL